MGCNTGTVVFHFHERADKIPVGQRENGQYYIMAFDSELASEIGFKALYPDEPEVDGFIYTPESVIEILKGGAIDMIVMNYGCPDHRPDIERMIEMCNEK